MRLLAPAFKSIYYDNNIVRLSFSSSDALLII